MKIFISARFKKLYDRLEKSEQNKVDKTIDLFVRYPFDVSLDNHKLHGKLKEFRSVKASFDLKIIYIEERGHLIVTFIKVGSHKEVYT